MTVLNHCLLPLSILWVDLSLAVHETQLRRLKHLSTRMFDTLVVEGVVI
jgi:hypothetical protein